jgi:hypothetical protein
MEKTTISEEDDYTTKRTLDIVNKTLKQMVPKEGLVMDVIIDGVKKEIEIKWKTNK